MSDKQMMTGIIIYLILSSIDRTEQQGKRGRKRIMQSVKKALTIEGKSDKDRYLRMVGDAESIINLTRDDISDKNFLINPGYIIHVFSKMHTEYIEPFGISEAHIENLRKAYKHSEAEYRSMQVANRIVKHVDEYVKGA